MNVVPNTPRSEQTSKGPSLSFAVSDEPNIFTTSKTAESRGGKCVVSGPILPSSPPGVTLRLGRALSETPWHSTSKLGDSPCVGSSSDRELLIDQMTSVLGLRLDDVIASRKEIETPSRRTKNIKISNHMPSLRAYVSRISGLYRNVSYHSLEHASHVTLSVNKMLSMIDEDGGLVSTRKENAIWQQQDLATSSSTSSSQGRRRSTIPAESALDIEKLSTVGVGHYFTPETLIKRDKSSNGSSSFATGKNNTFGIYCDPLAKFAVVFSALVHDVDHRGVPNEQLVNEKTELALEYEGKSVAEQNSLRIAFSILNEATFEGLRQAIAPTTDQKFRFRQIVTDMLFSTDISCDVRIGIGMKKWKMAFASKDADPKRGKINSLMKTKNNEQLEESTSLSYGTGRRHSMDSLVTACSFRRAVTFSGATINPFNHYPSDKEEGRENITASEILLFKQQQNNLKKSVTLEQIMQAADVAHTMQSWSMFIKWNGRLYRELHDAYVDGRGPDPSLNWFQGQIDFYDYYIIPLTKRLVSCGVFGKERAMSEFLLRAQDNRGRWLKEGEGISEALAKMVRVQARASGRKKQGDGGGRISPRNSIAAVA